MARNNDFLKGNLGVAATGVRAVEYGDKYMHATLLILEGANAAMPDIAGGGNLAVGKALYTFPAGAVAVEATKMSVALTQTQGNITADTPDIGIGTTIASGAVAVLGGTAAFENVLTGQTAADCDGTATVKTVQTNLVIESGDSHVLYLNVADGWAASGDDGAIITGSVLVHWRFMG